MFAQKLVWMLLGRHKLYLMDVDNTKANSWFLGENVVRFAATLLTQHARLKGQWQKQSNGFEPQSFAVWGVTHHPANSAVFPMSAVRLPFSPCLCFTGMLCTSASSSCPGVALSLEQGDTVARLPADPSAGSRAHTTLSGRHRDGDDSQRPEEVRARHTLPGGKSAVHPSHVSGYH